MSEIDVELRFVETLKNKPYQVVEELALLIKHIKHLNLQYVVEIGAGFGGTTEVFSYLTSHLISIDSGNPRFDILDINRRCKYRYLRGDSHHDEAQIEVTKIFKGNKIDLLFIDGDHSYAGAKLDYLQFKDFVAPGGLIVFHDIVNSELHRLKKCEVFILWNELKEKHKCIEIIKDGTWGGIGIIQNGQ